MAGCERPCRAQPADRSLSRRTGAPHASATIPDRSRPVHGGYTRSRQVGECNGHQRSRRLLRNRRSADHSSHDQGTLQSAVRSSSLPTTAGGSVRRCPTEAQWVRPLIAILLCLQLYEATNSRKKSCTKEAGGHTCSEQ
jgi:hypothetical protein